jgi:hypothetical protein
VISFTYLVGEISSRIFKFSSLLSSFSSLFSCSFYITVYTWLSYLIASSCFLRTFTFLVSVKICATENTLCDNVFFETNSFSWEGAGSAINARHQYSSRHIRPTGSGRRKYTDINGHLSKDPTWRSSQFPHVAAPDPYQDSVYVVLPGSTILLSHVFGLFSTSSRNWL